MAHAGTNLETNLETSLETKHELYPESYFADTEEEMEQNLRNKREIKVSRTVLCLWGFITFLLLLWLILSLVWFGKYMSSPWKNSWRNSLKNSWNSGFQPRFMNDGNPPSSVTAAAPPNAVLFLPGPLLQNGNCVFELRPDGNLMIYDNESVKGRTTNQVVTRGTFTYDPSTKVSLLQFVDRNNQAQIEYANSDETNAPQTLFLSETGQLQIRNKNGKVLTTIDLSSINVRP